MMCENPFVKTPVGVDLTQVCVSEEYRQAATPQPCGRCLPCRVNKKRVWVTRCILESMCYEHNTFTTLTYNDENLPPELVRKDLTDYMKNLRRIRKIPTRYLGVGEYGSRSGRPHYHLLLFGIHELLAKETTEKAWKKGFHYHGNVTKESIEYVTGYVAKGWTFDKCDKLEGRAKEFASQSRRNPGGIGLPGIIQMAERIRESGYDFGIIREFRLGRAKYPLGRYLTKKLSEYLNLSEEFVDAQVRRYQIDTITKHWKSARSGNGLYKPTIVADGSQKRKQQKKRINLKKKREMI